MVTPRKSRTVGPTSTRAAGLLTRALNGPPPAGKWITSGTCRCALIDEITMRSFTMFPEAFPVVREEYDENFVEKAILPQKT